MNSLANDLPSEPLDDTKHAVREFVQLVIALTSPSAKGNSSKYACGSRWRQGTDGNFREQQIITQHLPWICDDSWLSEQPEYLTAQNALRNDPLVGSQLGQLIGTQFGSQRCDENGVLRAGVYAMLNDDGDFSFSGDAFDRFWSETVRLFSSSQFRLTVVAPLPHISTDSLPLTIADDLVVDRFTSEEISNCWQAGILRSTLSNHPIIFADVAKGIRWTRNVPRIIGRNDIDGAIMNGDGRFANRPPLRWDLLVNDVLSTLRLLKPGRLCVTGTAAWVDVPLLGSGVMFQHIGNWPAVSHFEIKDGDVPDVTTLWQQLCKLDASFEFVVHRFNLSFERRLLTDRIVDLVIAAESLFLKECSDRGELSFGSSGILVARTVGHEVEFSTIEQDAEAIVVEGSEAAGITLEGLDFAIEAFGGRIGEWVLDVSDDVLESAFQHLGDTDDWLQARSAGPPKPLLEEFTGCRRVLI